jgi:predicted RNase H-like nuclease (RuvC/YqgF family)
MSLYALALMAMMCCFFGAGCDKGNRADLLRQIRQLQEDNAHLENEKNRLQAENSRLNARVHELAVQIEGGLGTEEQSKALARKQAELDELEKRLDQRQENLRQAKLQVEALEQEFWEKTNMTMVEIGEARQIQKEYENMREARNAAENRANNWLKFFAGLLVVFFVGAVALAVYVVKYINRNKQVDAAMKVIDMADSDEINPRIKELVAQSFARPLLPKTNIKRSDENK